MRLLTIGCLVVGCLVGLTGRGEESLAYLCELVDWPSSWGPIPTISFAPTPQEELRAFPVGENVKYGVIRLGNGQDPLISVAIREGPDPAIWVDANNNEDLTDDGGGKWDLQWRWNSFVWYFTVFVDYLKAGVDTIAPYTIEIVAYNPSGSRWEVSYASHCLRKGLLEVEGTQYAIWIGDMDSDGRYDDIEDLVVVVDVDGDGMPCFSPASPEIFFPRHTPVQIGMTLYVVDSVSPDGREVRLQQAGAATSPLPFLSPGHPAPAFTSQTIEGHTISLTDYRGDVTVLVFVPIQTCVNCPACVEAPLVCARVRDLNLLDHRDDIHVIAIATDDVAPMREQIRAVGIEYPVIWDPELVMLYRVTNTWLFIVDGEGNIRAMDQTFLRYQDGHLVKVQYSPLTIPEILGAISQLVPADQ